MNLGEKEIEKEKDQWQPEQDRNIQQSMIESQQLDLTIPRFRLFKTLSG